MTAIGTLLVRVADGTDVFGSPLKMTIVAIVSVKLAMTQPAWFLWNGKRARFQRLFEGLVVLTFVTFTGRTPFSFAPMLIMIESAITLVAEVGCVHKSLERRTSIVMLSVFD